MDDIVYFELNNWFSGRDYPDIEPISRWVEKSCFSDDDWCRENGLCVVAGAIDMSENWCISAKKEWVMKNAPDLLSDKEYSYIILRHFANVTERIETVAHYSDFLRNPDEYGEVYGRFGWLFAEYCEENFGVQWNDDD